ncbi:uncharacterized protein LOC126369081 [Pectinophora gossypiella]|uniref:uncharacterized protein LOC126369081 n=1 Tax=Pectinophora gossypiella TaxID=13191 RepID=UPI00214F3640|nr:uncharacterized protein LOC126369081 [Pectinophora gossypiella]
MIKLPKTKRDPNTTKDLCKCRPICKSRRRDWKGEIQNPSAELLIDRKDPAECFRRWPMKIYPNSPCPLFARNKQVIIKERFVHEDPGISVVRICPAPIDDIVDTFYMQAADIARNIGALKLVKKYCPCCCRCGCICGEYVMKDPEGESTRRQDMRRFDARVKEDCLKFRAMYM